MAPGCGASVEPMSPTAHLLRRQLRDDAFQRVAGAPLVGGNRLDVLRDAAQNYPAWLSAIEGARHTVHLEMYIIHADATGRRFRDLLVRKAKEGTRVRILYDWFGSVSLGGWGFWRPLIAAGGEVRVANTPAVHSLLGWASRDHRKLLAVDGTQAFISGLCIGDAWPGNPSRGVAPWRDTGVSLVGPAVADAEVAFAAAWHLQGPPIPADDVVPRERIGTAGTVSVRIVATSPETAGLYRMDLLVAVAARERLWLTDAYFMATSPYRQALSAAAAAGVDVRLLLPHASDIGWMASVSRAMYRPLLEAGVRIFEWNGPMVHAKTAVADGRWARVGSTNLNVSSWIGNWELDVAIEDEGVAGRLEQMFIEDLDQSTEIVLSPRKRWSVRTGARLTPSKPVRRGGHRGRSRMLPNAATVGSAVGAAVRGHRTLGPAESTWLFTVGLAVLGVAGVSIVWPRAVAYTVGVVLMLTALSLFVRAFGLRRQRNGSDDGSPDQPSPQEGRRKSERSSQSESG